MNRSSFSRHVRSACVFACISFAFAGSVHAQSATPVSDLWIANGTVYSMVRSGTSTYIGGSFTQVSPATGGGVPTSLSTGQRSSTFPSVNGVVYAAVSDGSNGWFIGGSFTYAGGVARNRLAHVLSDGTVDASWNPNANGTVKTLFYDQANSTVYAGGEFTTIGGTARNYIAAVSSATGALTSWNPAANSYVNSIVVTSTTLYAGGSFTSIGGSSRNYVAAINTATGTSTAWNPNAGGNVKTLLMKADGSTVYAGGEFTTIGSDTRNYIAEISVGTGTSTAWNPNADSTVYALSRSGNNVLIGGAFTNIGGTARNYIAAIDKTSGTSTAWNPNADDVVYAISVYGSNAYLGGSFNNIGGSARLYVAALDLATSTASSWNPVANNTIYALEVNSGGTLIYVGGDFSGMNGVVRNRLAEINLSTGQPTSWTMDAGDTVYALALSPNGNTLYVGGAFTTIGGSSRNRIAAVSPSTSNSVTAWNPNSNNTVEALMLNNAGTVVYAGGSFTNIGGSALSYVAGLDSGTGSVMSGWTDPGLSHPVHSLTKTSTDSRFFAGLGKTTCTLMPFSCEYFGSVQEFQADGTFVPATVGLRANNHVRAIAMSPDNKTLYAGGDFSKIQAIDRNRIAAVNLASGELTSWDPNASAAVYSLAADPSGSYVYVGGSFTTIGGSSRSNIAAINASGTASGWSPTLGSTVYTISLGTRAEEVMLGGDFTAVNTLSRQALARFLSPSTVQVTASPSSGSEGTPTHGIRFTLSASTTEDVSVPYTITGTAYPGRDFSGGTTGTAIIREGTTSVALSNTILDDGIIDFNRTLIVTASAPYHANLGAQTSATYTITDNDTHGGIGHPAEWDLPPQGPYGVTIQGGASQTNARLVELTLQAGKDVASVALSNTADFLNAGIRPFAERIAWDLCSVSGGLLAMPNAQCGQGTKTVYARFYTQYGVPSPVMEDTINYTASVLTKLADTLIAATNDPTLLARAKGRILLQVQSRGEAWYVDPVSEKRYYMKDGPTAYQMMRSFGLGVSEKDYASMVGGDGALLGRLRGRIILRVHEHGEAYYIHPDDLAMHYLKNGDEAYSMMRFRSLGITNEDLSRIPSATIPLK